MFTRPRIIRLVAGQGPLAAAAIHDGSGIRSEIEPLLRLTAEERRREEDPFTARLAEVAPTRFIGLRSRFEVDLNRPREHAVYRRPEDAWGLDVWKTPPSPELVRRSLAEYDRFYAAVRRVLRRLVRENGSVFVFDLHSYNHCRDGSGGATADPLENPEVNIGTGTMNRQYWAPVVERFIADLRSFNYLGRKLDVRENVRFFGGHFGRWIHQTFPASVCVPAIEFKKFYMDEWTGQVDERQLDALREALRSTIPGILQSLKGAEARVESREPEQRCAAAEPAEDPQSATLDSPEPGGAA